jgi:threonine/homoserine/homoserine lactone efflux protein
MTPDFLVTALVVVVTPGAGVLYTIAIGLAAGRRASAVAAAGCTVSILPHMAAAITGVAALLHASALAFQTLKWLGLAYLLYLAWQTLRAQGALELSEDTAGTAVVSDRRIVQQAILINLLNPKLSIFFLAFLPQFVPAGTPDAVSRMLQLGAAFMALTFVVFLGYGLFASAARWYVLARPRVLGWLRCGIAAAFVALGVRLALAER